ncbi:triose or hexose phosphate/phosphate translocator, putative [Plasmodium knowlesi strain H]|uniref:Triose or hexose phosphate/phosphate translocator, putative n=3 Tax=Plasmodium knowlesi TaxID=5850 RepID=A0A5K1VPM0_PLAKH|nr:triose phosphate transporter, putative [Plasmodium knowlesi strain H]OTN66933.1 putative Triose or hexose phosphate/phosphate translocator [Plasmodium knowlesi]CAA9988757.1 triose phosphate transporter, putative [Plasmodium knowlesi strain H]SBO21706.1 triose or hexose phosphate/phosphate translocator, putative [Plasmodium knowlesi strain H]SBO22088.1 triose or hexose phosphate/phosphate translocator, putative [Plasmodium knowlesi strain H]VVS78231.1 triose phosphate transporter, putative [|eukprot:XP_002259733.1 triose or hexose phosphate/phosphate translocator, putative [Plasmodium knowlesi strain H]
MKDNTKNEYGTFPIMINEGHSDQVGEKKFLSGGIYHSILEKAKLLCLFLTWYALNILYNVDNKIALNMTKLPWFISSVQLFTGWVFISIYWLTGYKKIPRIYTLDLFLKNIGIQSFCHIMVHFGAVVSMSCTTVSFTHVVKACEPVFTALLSILLLKQYMKISKYLTLLIIVGGVICASVKEIHFTWLSFWCATISNLGSSLRSICAKKMMTQKSLIGENLSASNIYSMITICSALMSLPLVIIFEGKSAYNFVTNYQSSAQSNHTYGEIITKIFLSGIWYYLNNEVAFMCLEKVNQVTHAVANCIKRVVIIVSSIIIFQTQITLLGALGSAVAITGAFLYSVI